MIVQNDLIELIKDSVVNMTKDEAKSLGYHSLVIPNLMYYTNVTEDIN